MQVASIVGDREVPELVRGQITQHPHFIDLGAQNA